MARRLEAWAGSAERLSGPPSLSPEPHRGPGAWEDPGWSSGAVWATASVRGGQGSA